MDFELSSEQKLIVETVRRFVRDEIVPLENDLDPDASELEPEDRDRLVAKVREMLVQQLNGVLSLSKFLGILTGAMNPYPEVCHVRVLQHVCRTPCSQFRNGWSDKIRRDRIGLRAKPLGNPLEARARLHP